MSVLKFSVSFNGGSNGANPFGSLIFDANGNLLGTTYGGGANGQGTVFEIAKTDTGYANTPTTLVSFNVSNGAGPAGSLIADATGNLFGTTTLGGANGKGAVFEIVKTDTGYANTPTTLVNFNGSNGADPKGSLIADANGDLFGTTTLGGTNNAGTVFEIIKTDTGYASTPITLASFDGSNTALPTGSLIADANGDLFGTTLQGGINNAGTVFEIVKTDSGYASTPITLVSFGSYGGLYGANPAGSLIFDANGNLFGTTAGGGASGAGTVFEIAKTDTGYASTPIVVVIEAQQRDGANPTGSLIFDANGNLFGTTELGGTNGTVFEIAKTDTGYASTPVNLVTFNSSNGDRPTGSLIADADGNLYGTTSQGGASESGTVFEFDIHGGVVGGDPHFTTFAGHHYDYQGVGDYVLTRSTVAANPFEVQIHTTPSNSANSVSIISEAAASLGDDAITFDLGRANAGDSFVWVDGQAPALSPDNPVLALVAGKIVELSADHYQVVWNSGEMLDVTAANLWINLNFTPAAQDGPGSMAGLLGNDSSGSSDFQFPDGSVLDPQTAAANGYSAFGNAWRVSDGSSLLGPAVTGSSGALLTPPAVSDFDGSGTSDILFENGNNDLYLWAMNGTAMLPASAPSAILVRAGWSRAPPISTATARPTSCSRTATATSICGR